MKSLSLSLRILITLGFVITLFNMFTYFAPTNAKNIFKSFENLDLFNKSSNVLGLFLFIIILSRIWKSKAIESSTKTLWTVLLILLQGLFGIYYLWKLDNKINIR